MIKYVGVQDPRFWELFEQLRRDVGWHSPLYTRSSLFYYRRRILDDGNKISDRSFIMLVNTNPVAAFLGALIGNSNGTQDMLAFEIPCQVIENVAKLTKALSKQFIGEINAILQEVSGKIWYRDILFNGFISAFSHNLLSKGGNASPVFSKVIDLSNEEACLKSQLRKSYRSLVNWGIRELNPLVVNKENVTWQMVNEFRQLHIREAGRETRSEASWKKQYEMVKAGDAFIIFGGVGEQLVSAGLFFCSDTTCFYAVSASKRDLFDKPLFHSLMWVAILYAKKHGYRLFEIGPQSYPNHFQNFRPTKKELTISDFKAGFGGQTIVYLDVLFSGSVNL